MSAGTVGRVRSVGPADPVGFVQIGPEWHGVTRFGRLLETRRAVA